MRRHQVSFAVVLMTALAAQAQTKKQIEDQRIDLLRGLDAEYATAQTYIPRSKRPLEFEAATGYWNKEGWQQIGDQAGPAAREGDMVQVTKVTIDKDAIVLELNHGFNGQGGHWYNNSGPGGGITDTGAPAPGGTVIAVHYPSGLAGVTSEKVKDALAPVLSFDARTATGNYLDKLPPEIKAAIADKKAILGMTRDQLLLAMGTPVRKSRENVNGDDLEFWVYGNPPGKVTFITLKAQKIVKVMDAYANPGGTVAETPLNP